MRCPMCGEAELVQDTRDLPYTYKGESTVIPAVTGEFCPACGEVILDAQESARNSAMMLDQREAAEIFGGGVNAFSRYENGKTKPPLALVKLLKVLERHPDLLAEIKMA
jgi:HTH-type transcriptional regulator/antitoxin MqsA